MKKIRLWWRETKNRWRAKTPKVFRRVQWFCAFISTVSIGINMACNMAGAIMPEWWITIYPYLIGASAALIAGYQFTQQYGRDGKPILPDVTPTKPKRGRVGRKKNESHNTVLDHDDF